MAKPPKVIFKCSNCEATFSKWLGQCTSCEEWNTIEESKAPRIVPEKVRSHRNSGYAGSSSQGGIPQLLSNVKLGSFERISTGFAEFDRVLGGGITPGSAILIGGHPGAGKSTLLLQTMCNLSKSTPILYATGEESLEQVAMRAQRLNILDNNLILLSEVSVEEICSLSDKIKPKIIVIDSIQVMHLSSVNSSPGSVSQVRECATYLTQYAKQNSISVIMVGHVTKDGSLAGPKVLEHCIDCSVLLEGESDSKYRTLRSYKNRFGSVNELGVFAMTQSGLKEVKNPSAIFLNRTDIVSPGSVIVVIWEGSRPLLIEIQALVDSSVGNMPKRISVGIDYNRVSLLIAILHRHGSLQISDQDIFINVVGGVKITETSSDLALIISLISSFQNKAIPHDLVSFGEVGLSGEIRAVTNGIERISEAKKHGFKIAIVPFDNKPKDNMGMKIYPVKTITDVLNVIREIT